MISLNLICKAGHEFTSLFQDQASFESLKAQGLLECVHCGSTKVDKGLSAPNLPAKSNQKSDKALQAKPINLQAILETPEAQALTAEIAAFKAKIKSTHIDVGDRFETIAREIYYGERDQENIIGTADVQTIKSLWEEGIEAVPLPSFFADDKEKN